MLPGVHASRMTAAAAITGGQSMETLAPALTCLRQSICITTEHPTEFIDLTDRLEALVAAAGQ
jgi:hypothetical protein